jgi:hypothetical protein
VSNYRYHNSSYPCPLCNGSTDCRTHATGRVHCRRASQHNPPADYRFVGDDKQGFRMFVPSDGRRGLADWAERQLRINDWLRGDEKKPSERKAAKITSMFERVAASRRPLKDDERNYLTQCLCIPGHILDELDVRTWDDDPCNRTCFTFPEKDAGGRVIGYTRRYGDGSKKNVGKRGLTLPPNWLPTGDEPLLLVEGASDVAACMAMELHAIGRPSNTGGVELLAELLREAAADGLNIIVVGENDKKDNGTWPGREGAESVANRLAGKGERQVSVAYPPDYCKDTRDWLKTTAKARGGRLTDEWAKIAGRNLLDHYKRTAKPFGRRQSPADPAAHDRPTQVELDRWYLKIPYTPPAVPAPRNLARCPTPRGVLLGHKEEPRDRLAFFCCRQHKCPYCGPELRSHWIRTAELALFEHKRRFGGETVLVFIFYCEHGAEWNAVRQRVRRAAGGYLRVHVDGKGLFFVCASIRPTSIVKEELIRTVTCDKALEQIRSQIQSIATAKNSKRFTTSENWRMRIVEKPGNWRRLGATTVSLADARTVLKEREASVREVSAKVGPDGNSERGPLGNWYGIEWEHGSLDVEHVRAEVREGALLPVTDCDEAATGNGVEAIAVDLFDDFFTRRTGGKNGSGR